MAKVLANHILWRCMRSSARLSWLPSCWGWTHVQEVSQRSGWHTWTLQRGGWPCTGTQGIGTRWNRWLSQPWTVCTSAWTVLQCMATFKQTMCLSGEI